MKERITVGLCGLNFSSGNLGCSALAYSFKSILDKIARTNGYEMDLYVISPFKQDVLMNNLYPVEYRLTDIRTHWKVCKVFKKCDFVFDFTEGDSFSDIYGIKRLVSNSFLKYMALAYSPNFILGPQTYGPFKRKWTSLVAKDILQRSNKVFSRDFWSSEYVKGIASIETVNVIDVAFALPYEQKTKSRNDKLCVGLNVSGLLWNGGYTGKNELGLKVDYKVYCEQVVKRILSCGEYDICLMPHVFSEDCREDDFKACMEIKKMFPECQIAPRFNNPIEAKSYISGMDIFIGARMHSTIAAYSSGVVTIPMSYSRKFEGLFSTLNYPLCINAREETTETAVEKTIRAIKKKDELKEKVKEGNTIATRYIKQFEQEIELLIK